MKLLDAAAEAVLAEVYRECLPFGAVPTLALALTDRHQPTRNGNNTDVINPRCLEFRPFVARPAHFMRNINDSASHRLDRVVEAGWSRDATRTRQAMARLALNLHAACGLPPPDDKAATLDAGLREVTRRYAWQCAASFARRMPHSALSCSNIALSGAYLDFGLAEHLQSYRRRVRVNGQDPWSEAFWPIRSVLSLREQLGRYRRDICALGVAPVDDLIRLHEQTLQERMAVEMAKMAGADRRHGDGLPIGPARAVVGHNASDLDTWGR